MINERVIDVRTVIKFIKPYKLIMILALVAKTLASFAELIIPSIMATIIDEDVPSGEMRNVIVSGGVMLLFSLLTFGFNILGNRAAARGSAYVAYDLRKALFKSTAHLDTEATDRIGLPSLTSRLTTDTYNITSFMARMLRIGVKAPLTLIGGIVITLVIDWRLALILVAILPLVSLTVYIVTKKSIPIYREEQEILDSLVRRIDETHSGVRVIKALSKTDYEKARFHETSNALARKEIQAGRLVSLTKPINDLLFYFGFCFVIILGAFLASRYNFDAVGKLLAFMTYFTVILNSMIMMTRIFIQASRSFASAARIEEVLNAERKLNLENSPQKENESFIVFDDVSFSYNKTSPNLEHVSFTLEKGQTLGIIGVTGSGKTTLINLLMRLYDPDSGEIRIDGRSLKSIPVEEVHSMFGIAFQNDFVFQGTVRDNVGFFRETDDGELSAALDTARAKGFVFTNEEGLDGHVTTGGTNISGGQKQRLTVARAVLKKSKILILDDASSALDYKTDKELRASIRNNIKTTAVIVAQRVSSVKSADKILVIDEGRIVASGTHAELLLTSSDYKEMAILQMGGDLV